MTRLKSKADEFRRLPAASKAKLLKECLTKYQKVDVKSWSADACAVNGIDLADHTKDALGNPTGPSRHALDALTTTSVIAGRITKLHRTLDELSKTGVLPKATSSRVRDDGVNVEQVFPAVPNDAYTPAGKGKVTAELWIEAGEVTQGNEFPGLEAVPDAEASGGVAVVLGAGNRDFLSFVDLLDCLIMRGEVAVLKLHDLRNYMLDRFLAILKPFTDKGYVEVVTGSLELAQGLIYHSDVAHVHMTGGNVTHDAILWGGVDDAAKKRREANTPMLRAGFTSELGNVTPWIVVPAANGSKWTTKETDYHAKCLAVAFIDQAGANCLSPKVLVLPKREGPHPFLECFKMWLGRMALEAPFYPGMHARYKAFLEQYDESEVELIKQKPYQKAQTKFGEPLPWAIVKVNPDGNQHALLTEAFAPIISVVEIDCPRSDEGNAEYLNKAVEFCNDKIWGSLCATLLIHPSFAAQNPDGVEKAIADLRYGQVVLNLWQARTYDICEAVWGAHPGTYKPEVDSCSGSGFVGNSLGYDKVIKAVVRSPFMSSAQIGGVGGVPTPALCFALTDFLRGPSFWGLMRVAGNSCTIL